MTRNMSLAVSCFVLAFSATVFAAVVWEFLTN